MILLTVYIITHVYGCDKDNGIKYILKWAAPQSDPFFEIGSGPEELVNKGCAFKNCFITNDSSYCDRESDFDAVVFNIPDLALGGSPTLPFRRKLSQKYVIYSWDPPKYYHMSKMYNTYFNWTWTYKLNSDVYAPFFIVKDESGKVIGPRKDMHWMDFKEMKPTPNYVKHKLMKKRYAAAWFVSNCQSGNGRTDFAGNLSLILKEHGQELHRYGRCSNRSCLMFSNECYELIESDYFFYLAFENTFGEDYVTEKLMTALKNFAVPVVYGGANYSSFMPNGIYLNACSLGPEKVAGIMIDAINNRDVYYNFFKWHNHYSYHYSNGTGNTAGICNLCAMLNNDTKSKEVTEYVHFTDWWNAGTSNYTTCAEHTAQNNIETMFGSTERDVFFQ